MIQAAEALELLRQGNRRFASDTGRIHEETTRDRRMRLTEGQKPFAVILGCSDSRVPAEIVFDRGLGDLFVIRVAGNIAAPSQIGSVEFAAEQFGTRLVVVLGHTHCGAIAATLKALQQQGGEPGSKNLGAIVSRVRTGIEGLLVTELKNDPDRLVRQATRANISAAANRLRHESDVIRGLIREQGLFVVGAEYSLESGLVEFFDGVRNLQ